jgi:DNA-binding PadR family transcriptional regulator
MRLSEKEALILTLLGKGELYGLELVDRSDGALKRGTAYVTLGRMEEKGLVTSRAEKTSPSTGGLPRRRYATTALGAALLDAERRAAQALRRARA